MRSELDHIVVVARNLAEGVEFVRRALGVAPQTGGEHTSMGTHNCLLRLGDKTYLEVIAINPGAPRPARSRWFGLDGLPADHTPRLAAWVARTGDIAATAAASPIVGKVTPMSRGSLSWHITIRDDGNAPMQGVAPSLIQWPSGIHPADKMPDSGCTLIALEGHHDDAAEVSSVLKSIGFDGAFRVLPHSGDTPHLLAHIRTPAGMRRLSTALS